MDRRHLLAGKLRHLSTIDIFSDLSIDELAEMNGQTSPVACESGRLLYAPGEPADALFLLGKGHVQLYRLSPNGRKLVVATLRAGAFFGAIPPVAQETHQTFAETIDDCVLYVLGRADAERLLREKPEVALRVVVLLGEWMRRLERRRYPRAEIERLDAEREALEAEYREAVIAEARRLLTAPAGATRRGWEREG
jgi:CRP-like cAMP-binding protein